MKLILQKPDTYGALASTLCIIHCVATPFFLVAFSYTIIPIWWKSLDSIFLVISFCAIYNSVQTTSKKIITHALWTSWTVLCILIINEKIAWIHIPEIATYFSAFMLAVFHIYNLNYCQCKTPNCRVKKK